MIPILYESTETSFTNGGICRLTDCISCTVHEERNGVYECEFEYPIIGAHFSDIIEGRIIACIHDETKTIQPFDIYAHGKPMDGIVTFYAHHISYRLGEITVKPFSASSCSQALQAFKQNSLNTNPFTFWTNKATTGNYTLNTPRILKEMLGGIEGSILDVYGGADYEFDKWTVKLHTDRGTASGVEIRYGKNLLDLQEDVDYSASYTGVVPYWLGQDEEQADVLVHLSTWILDSGNNTYGNRRIIVPMDLSSEFESKPTEAELRTKAETRLADSEAWLPSASVTVDFVQLWQTEEYKNYAPLQRVRLCDTVSVIYPALGVNAVNQKVVDVVYDVLMERYSEMTLGEPTVSFAQLITEQNKQAIAEANARLRALLEGNTFALQAEIDESVTHATEMITGGLGGYVVMNHDGNGHPQEILILDDPDINNAINVIRMNRNGIGFSNDGYDGTYRTAWTIDSHFVADFITTGTLTANLIKAGLLSDVAGRNYWNMETGEFSLQAYSTTTAMNTAINTAVNNYRQEVNALIQDIQDQLDGVVDTYYKPYAPTMTNVPTSDWATSEYPDHEGDMILDTSTGKSYRFVNENGTWQWKEIPDTASAAALVAAQNAQATADGKRRVFTAQPYTPYDVGDLWVEGSNGDIKVCTYSRQSGNYTASDWNLASKYTDDSSFNAFLDGTYADFVTNTTNSLGTKVQVFYMGSTPSGANVGDLWIQTNQGNKLYRYGGTSTGWVTVQDTQIQSALSTAGDAQATADSKIITYAQNEQPSGTSETPLGVGDLWIDTDNHNKLYRYDGTSWIAYTDTSALLTWINGDFKNTIDSVKNQVDGKVETWYQTSNPSSAWTTTELQQEHKGDIWFCSNTTGMYAQKTWQWDGSGWLEMKTTPPTSVMDTIDGKAQIFVVQPATPYQVGDLWFNSATSDILTCVTARASGNYVSTDWEKRNKYTDDSSLTAFQNGTYADFVTDTNNTLAKKVTTFYTGSTPDGANVGDLWIKTSQQNKLFRYTLLQNNQKGWVEVRDAGIQQALNDAADAQATADSKIITYAQTDQPAGTTSQPLDIGDLWIDTDDGNRMYRYDGSDWIPYTDISELTTFINGDYADDIESIQTQVDQKIETWYQTNDPSTAWTTADLKQAHKGDLWYNSSTTGTNAGVTKRWTGMAWETQNIPKAVFDEIDGKAAIFYGQPTGSYSGVATGDYLVDSTDGSTYRYNGSSWVKVTDYKTYTDDSVSTAIDTYDDDLTQTVIFNKLTNNGETQGIYLQNGKLYINGTYIQTGYLSADRIQGGTFKVGGSNNNYGRILIYNESGVEQGRINSAQIYFKGVGDYADYGASAIAYGGFSKFHKDGSELYRLTLNGAVVTPYSSTSYTIGRLVVNSNKIFCIGDTSYGLFFKGGGNVIHCKGYLTVHQQLECKSGLKVTGTKSREADTADYGKRLLYCYETPTPMFGDIGEGTIGDDGSCYVWLDPIFSETISATQYQVFLQLYGEGDCYIAEKNSSYFKVAGTAGLTFGWEIKAKQAGFEQRRLDTWIEDVNDNEYADLGENGANYYVELMKGRIA